MNLPVEVPGLDTIIPQIPEGSVVIVESGADSAKSFFVRRLGLTAARLGWPVSFVTSRDREELVGQLTTEGKSTPPLDGWLHIHERDDLRSLEDFADPGGFLAVDSFSFLTLQLPGHDLAALLRGVRALARKKAMAVLLATDRGMFQPQSEAVVIHLADGMLQFHAREGAEGLVRFLRIPKWVDGKFVDRNIYYEFDGKRLAIDLRSRVL